MRRYRQLLTSKIPTSGAQYHSGSGKPGELDQCHRRELKAVVMAVRTGGELRHRRKSRIGWLHVGKWREAPWAHRLIAIHLRQIGLIDGTSDRIAKD